MLYRRKTFLPCLVLLAGLAAACGKSTTRLPEVVPHPQPALKADQSLYAASDCTDEYYFRTCAPQSPLGRLGCRQVFSPADSLGGLSPSVPLLLCGVEAEQGAQLAADEYLFKRGCKRPLYLRLIAQEEGGYRVIRNTADLKTAFAPLDTPDEALSYAVAATGYQPLFGQQPNPAFRYFTGRLEDTHVRTLPDGYRVNLADDQFCGCGPHTVYSVEVTVTRAGDVRVGARRALYQDPGLDDTCYD